MTNSTWFCLVVFASLSVTACQPRKSVDGNDIAGVYTLLKVNGEEVPATVSHDGTSMRVRSGTFTIKADGTCISQTVFTAPDGVERSREVRAQYERTGSRLIMRWEGAGTTEGTVEGDTFVMDNHGMIFEYTRKR